MGNRGAHSGASLQPSQAGCFLGGGLLNHRLLPPGGEKSGVCVSWGLGSEQRTSLWNQDKNPPAIMSFLRKNSSIIALGHYLKLIGHLYFYTPHLLPSLNKQLYIPALECFSPSGDKFRNWLLLISASLTSEC